MLTSNRPKRDEHRVVYLHSIVQKCTDDLLYAREVFGIKGGVVRYQGILNLGAIGGHVSNVRRSLGTFRGVLDFVEFCLYVTRHVEDNGALGVVPGKVNAEILFFRPIEGEFVLFFECLDEVVGVGFG